MLFDMLKNTLLTNIKKLGPLELDLRDSITRQISIIGSIRDLFIATIISFSFWPCDCLIRVAF